MEKLENNAAYIQSWLKRLKEDKRFIVHASAQAQKATDFILNINNEEKELDLSVAKIEKTDEPVVKENISVEKNEREEQLRSIREKSNCSKEINIEI